MDDLISRQAAIDALGEEPEVWSNDNEYELGMRNQWLYDRKTLESLPPAQLQRRTGKWISLDDFRGKYNTCGYECSECGEYSGYEENYCPNCGARMVKEDEEHD